MPFALFAADPPRGLALLATLWPIWLPLIAGGLAIYWLLPRPKAVSPLLGPAAGIFALLLAGSLLVRTGTFTIEALLFYAFAGLAIVAGALVVTQRHPARAALSFALVVLSTCGLFMLLAAPFLMAASIIVYAGAIVVTFLFVIMLAQQEGLDNADARSREPIWATITGFLLLAGILLVLRGYRHTADYNDLLAEVNTLLDSKSPSEMKEQVGDIGTENNLFRRAKEVIKDREGGDLDRALDTAITEWGFLPEMDGPRPINSPTERTILLKVRSALLEGRQRLTVARLPDSNPGDAAPDGTRTSLPISAMSGTPANTPAGEVRRNPQTLTPDLPAENSAYLGRSLFTDFLLPVELGGTLLLVATVGAIAIAQKRGEPDSTLPIASTPRPGRNA